MPEKTDYDRLVEKNFPEAKRYNELMRQLEQASKERQDIIQKTTHLFQTKKEDPWFYSSRVESLLFADIQVLTRLSFS